MITVMKYTLAGPDYMVDSFYDEVVTTHNGIALVQFEHNAEGMRKNGYDVLGRIEKAEDLPVFLDNLNKKEVKEAAVAKIKPLNEVL